MVRNTMKVVIGVVVLVLISPCYARADFLPGLSQASGHCLTACPAGTGDGGYCSLGLKKFLSSFTSYQFPNPFVPESDPLSRLEFPIDQLFGGVTAGFRAREWFMDGQAWINATRISRLKMQDSDWEDETLPHQKTVFSESRCRLNKGLLFDFAVGLAVPKSLFCRAGDLYGAVGCRYQSFFFTTYSGRQGVLGDDESVPLHGDGIEFTQNFWHYYLGARAATCLDPGVIISGLPKLNLTAQIDYGWVIGKNEDLHLLREGHRVTNQNTRGHCWHGFISLEFLIRSGVRTMIEADFKRSLTRGSHRLTNSIFELDFSFEGSRVWSDQISLSAIAEIPI